jgi:hypothetical protein
MVDAVSLESTTSVLRSRFRGMEPTKLLLRTGVELKTGDRTVDAESRESGTVFQMN